MSGAGHGAEHGRLGRRASTGGQGPVGERRRSGAPGVHGARPAQQFQKVVEQNRNNQDVERRSNVQARQGSDRQCDGGHRREFYGIAAVPLGASRGLIASIAMLW